MLYRTVMVDRGAIRLRWRLFGSLWQRLRVDGLRVGARPLLGTQLGPLGCVDGMRMVLDLL